MIIEKQTQAQKNQSEQAVDKIAQLRVVLEDLTKEVDAAYSKRDKAVQEAETANIDLGKIKDQIVEAQKTLDEMEKVLGDKIERSANELNTYSEKLGAILAQIPGAQIQVAGLLSEIKQLTLKKENLLQVERQHDELKTKNEELQRDNAKKQKISDDLDIAIKEKRKKELKEAEELSKVKLENEALLAKIEGRKEFIEDEKERIKDFCEQNNIPFSLEEQEVEDAET